MNKLLLSLSHHCVHSSVSFFLKQILKIHTHVKHRSGRETLVLQAFETGGKMKICSLDEDTLLEEIEASTSQNESMESVCILQTTNKT